MLTYFVCGANQTKREKQIKNLITEKKPKNSENDPDILYITSDKEIGVEEIRHLKYWFSLKAFQTPPKVAVIDKAKTLSEEAQAILGQLIEQEGENNILILGAPNTESLNQNIISRSQVISLTQETEIGLNNEEIIIEKDLSEQIINLPLGPRLKFSEQYKTKEDALNFCQRQLTYWRKLLLENPDQENLRLCRFLEKSLRYLNSNVNPRLTIDNLLISYPLK
jgi:DNA polymerase III delta prime subunit